MRYGDQINFCRLAILVKVISKRRPYNTLTLKGSFSQAEMHNWIAYCIPEVPEKYQTVENGKAVYHFQNVFSGTMLQCEYW